MATRQHLARGGSAKHGRWGVEAGLQPTLVVLSEDDSILTIVDEADFRDWHVEGRDVSADGCDLQTLRNIRMVIFDDEKAEVGDRAGMLGRIRRYAPQAAILYIAQHHDWDTERQARTGGAQYYCSKPIDRALFAEVVNSFLRAIK
jgi:DNA-binding NarL/FixJ family response regulator